MANRSIASALQDDTESVTNDEMRNCNQTIVHSEASSAFLSLPRELRDMIYAKWLETDSVATYGNTASIEYKTVAEAEAQESEPEIPAFYSPWQYISKSANHPLSLGDERRGVPQLWSLCRQMRTEAMELQLNDRLLLDMKLMALDSFLIDARNPVTSLDLWIAAMSKQALRGIRKIHISARCELFAKGDFAKHVKATPNTKWEKLSECNCDILRLEGSWKEDDPLFKLELEDDNQTLVVRTFGKFVDTHEAFLRGVVNYWWQRRAASPAIDGLDLLLVARHIALADPSPSYGPVYNLHALEYGKPPCAGCGLTEHGRNGSYTWRVEATEQNTELVEIGAVVCTDTTFSKSDRDARNARRSRVIRGPGKVFRLRSGYNAWQNIDTRGAMKYDHIVMKLAIDSHAIDPNLMVSLKQHG